MCNFSSNFDFLFFSETWQRIDDEFELDGYESILVPRVESINNSSKRGHGGIARKFLFYKKCLKPGINTVEKILVDLSVLSYVNYTFSLSLTYMCVVHIYRPVIIIIYCHIIQGFLKCWNLKSGCIVV